MGGYHNCTLDASGTIDCWGADSWGQVSSRPSGSGYAQVSSGNFFSCALDASGGVDCWGDDFGLQVSNAPTDSGYTALTTGAHHACVLDPSGTIDCWGWDLQNQVTDTPSGSGYTALSGGFLHTCALDSAGEIECWGDATYGQLSDIPALDSDGGLVCTIQTESTDDDDDSITYTVEWDVDGTDYTDTTTTDYTGDTVPVGDYALGETWTCTVTPNDGDGDGESAESELLLAYTCDDDGTAEDCPALSCKDILDRGYDTGDGTYWIDIDGSGAFEVYCDMTTDSGGWTLVAYMPTAAGGSSLYTASAYNASDCVSQTGHCKLSDDEINAILSVGSDTDDRFRMTNPNDTVSNGSTAGPGQYYWDTTSDFAYDNADATTSWWALSLSLGGSHSPGCRHPDARGAGHYPTVVGTCATGGGFGPSVSSEINFYHTSLGYGGGPDTGNAPWYWWVQ
ncbi:MAG TPA: hypothetical protein DFR83_04290 [Deltaproteobacteria bacterium]|nr:hypothetical protein [Deltaproteobacteria bacterium]